MGSRCSMNRRQFLRPIHAQNFQFPYMSLSPITLYQKNIQKGLFKEMVSYVGRINQCKWLLLSFKLHFFDDSLLGGSLIFVFSFW